MLTDLAAACRKSGLPVTEIDGWRTRGHGSLSAVETIACHHTATPKSAAGDYPSLRVVRDGRSDLPGPLSQLGLGRDGTVYVIAAGVAYHAGATFTTAQDNWHAIGIEAEHDGVSPWPPAQYAAYVRLVAALCEHYGLAPARALGHKEIATPKGRKIDPNFDMIQFRSDVTREIANLRALRRKPIRRTLRKITTAIQQAKADGYTGLADALKKNRERARKNHAR
ncbi:peptidoglycan recognition protein family protein [Nocardioides terrigena]|uniref:peptidoglycan recognition protein family protein n=1 Tax=Nocardioides terrigena TaxID=424797 RepID=UPI000D2FD110|nr:N-acetylmuramoyl-L-alanine amidase [Nocardioides terrigena]